MHLVLWWTKTWWWRKVWGQSRCFGGRCCGRDIEPARHNWHQNGQRHLSPAQYGNLTSDQADGQYTQNRENSRRAMWKTANAWRACCRRCSGLQDEKELFVTKVLSSACHMSVRVGAAEASRTHRKLTWHILIQHRSSERAYLNACHVLVFFCKAQSTSSDVQAHARCKKTRPTASLMRRQRSSVWMIRPSALLFNTNWAHI